MQKNDISHLARPSSAAAAAAPINTDSENEDAELDEDEDPESEEQDDSDECRFLQSQPIVPQAQIPIEDSPKNFYKTLYSKLFNKDSVHGEAPSVQSTEIPQPLTFKGFGVGSSFQLTNILKTPR